MFKLEFGSVPNKTGRQAKGVQKYLLGVVFFLGGGMFITFNDTIGVIYQSHKANVYSHANGLTKHVSPLSSITNGDLLTNKPVCLLPKLQFYVQSYVPEDAILTWS